MVFTLKLAIWGHCTAFKFFFVNFAKGHKISVIYWRSFAGNVGLPYVFMARRTICADNIAFHKIKLYVWNIERDKANMWYNKIEGKMNLAHSLSPKTSLVLMYSVMLTEINQSGISRIFSGRTVRNNNSWNYCSLGNFSDFIILFKRFVQTPFSDRY